MIAPHLFLGSFASAAAAQTYVQTVRPTWWTKAQDEVSPYLGLVYYNTTYSLYYINNGTDWVPTQDYPAYVLMNAEEYDVLEANRNQIHINLYGAGTATINLPEDAPAGWAVTIIQGQAQELRLTPPTGHAFLGSTEDFYLLLAGATSRPLAVEVVKIHGDNWAVIDFFDPAIATNFSFVDPHPV